MTSVRTLHENLCSQFQNFQREVITYVSPLSFAPQVSAYFSEQKIEPTLPASHQHLFAAIKTSTQHWRETIELCEAFLNLDQRITIKLKYLSLVQNQSAHLRPLIPFIQTLRLSAEIAILPFATQRLDILLQQQATIERSVADYLAIPLVKHVPHSEQIIDIAKTFTPNLVQRFGTSLLLTAKDRAYSNNIVNIPENLVALNQSFKLKDEDGLENIKSQLQTLTHQFEDIKFEQNRRLAQHEQETSKQYCPLFANAVSKETDKKIHAKLLTASEARQPIATGVNPP